MKTIVTIPAYNAARYIGDVSKLSREAYEEYKKVNVGGTKNMFKGGIKPNIKMKKISEKYKFLLKTPLRISFERILKKRLPKYSDSVLEIGINHYKYGPLIKSQIYHILDINKNFKPDLIADCHDMSMIKDQSYSVVLLFGLLEHCKDPHKVILEVRRIMKEDGKCFILIPFMQHIHGAPEDYVRFTKDGLKELLNDFNNIEIITIGNRLMVIYHLISYVIKPLHLFNYLISFFNSENTKCPLAYFVECEKQNI